MRNEMVVVWDGMKQDSIPDDEGDIQQEIFPDREKIANALKAGKEPKGFMGMEDESKQIGHCLASAAVSSMFQSVHHTLI